MGRLFGTDGIRGRVNQDLTAELALDLAVAAAYVLGAGRGRRLRALVGRDPRISGQLLESAVVAGLASAGTDVTRVGVLPTPAVAHLVRAEGADLGVVLSASHNPMPDNGIKFFAGGGYKLADQVEDEIEAALSERWRRPMGADVGRVADGPQLAEDYIHHLTSSLSAATEGRNPLKGLRVVIDVANGAAHRTAPAAFRACGAEVIVIHGRPDGLNINDRSGSTHPEVLQRAVLEHGADLGLALDGDGDRCVAVAADGEIVDGDQIMAILAVAMRERGQLADNIVVTTVMSNLGFARAMEHRGIRVVRTRVGDRYVLAEMRRRGAVLGGEQSGHVLLRDYATTGDGALTGLHLMAVMAETGAPLGDLASLVERMPQVLINVPGVDLTRADSDPVVHGEVLRATAELGDDGRVLLRPSGTEPLVRVMVEASDADRARRIADRLAEVVRERLGQPAGPQDVLARD